MALLRAIVLAAGAGSRLWPYTDTRPKPMVPVGGRPLLAWVLDALSETEVTDVQLVVGYKGNRIQSYVEDGRAWGLSVTYVRQQVLLGSGAALSTALQDGGVPEQALVLGGDNLVDAGLVQSLLDEGPEALAVARTAEPSKYGLVHLQGDDRITGIDEKPPVRGEGLVSTGVCLLSGTVLQQVPKLVEEGMLGLAHILDHVARGAGQGLTLTGLVDAGLWRDVVYPWDILEVTDELLDQVLDLTAEDHRIDAEADVSPEAHLTGPLRIGRGATIEPGAIVRGPGTIGANARIQAGAIVNASVVMDDAVIGSGATVERSVIGEGSHIHSGATLACGAALAETQEEVRRLEETGAMIGEGCTVEGGGLVLPGGLLGNGSRVRAGAHARGRVPEGSEVT